MVEYALFISDGSNVAYPNSEYPDVYDLVAAESHRKTFITRRTSLVCGQFCGILRIGKSRSIPSNKIVRSGVCRSIRFFRVWCFTLAHSLEFQTARYITNPSDQRCAASDCLLDLLASTATGDLYRIVLFLFEMLLFYPLLLLNWG